MERKYGYRHGERLGVIKRKEMERNGEKKGGIDVVRWRVIEKRERKQKCRERERDMVRNGKIKESNGERERVRYVR